MDGGKAGRFFLLTLEWRTRHDKDREFSPTNAEHAGMLLLSCIPGIGLTPDAIIQFVTL